MNIDRRFLLRSLLAASALPCLPECAWAAATALRVGDQKGGAHALLTAAGLAAQNSLSLQWSLFAGAPMLIQALTAGAVDVGVIGDAPLVFAQAGGCPIKAVAGIQTDGTMTAVIVRKDSRIHTVADLKGKSVATLRSQTGHYLMLAALRKAGLKDNDVRFVFIPPTSAKMALQNGSVDAWATWGPYIAEAKINDGAREIVNGGDLMSGLSYIVATDEACAAKSEEIRAYCRLLHEGHVWMLTHQDDYASAWAKETGLSVPVAREVVKTMVASVVPLDATVLKKQQSVSDFMTETRMVAPRLDTGAIAASGFTF